MASDERLPCDPMRRAWQKGRATVGRTGHPVRATLEVAQGPPDRPYHRAWWPPAQTCALRFFHTVEHAGLGQYVPTPGRKGQGLSD